MNLAAVAATSIAFALYARVEWPWVWLGWIGLVPWLAALDRTTSLRASFVSGVLMCAGFTVAVFAWFASAIASYTGISYTAALVVLLLLSPVVQPQLIVFPLARHVARRSGGGLVSVAVAGALAYVGGEWALPKLFADTIGHGLYASPLMRQAADLGGAPLLTFVLVVTNECLLAALLAATAPSTVEARLRRAFAPSMCGLTLVIGLTAYGAARYRTMGGGAGERPIAAGLVQADLSQYRRLATDLGTYDAARLILDRHMEMSESVLERSRLDVVVWPETVYPTTFGSPKSADGAALDREIAAFVMRHHVPLIFGSYDVEGSDEYNAAFFLEPSGNGKVSFDTYRKSSLFPLTERVPSLLDSAAVRSRWPWLGTWKPGSGASAVPLRLADGRVVRIAPLICYDAVDPRLALDAVRQGAQLIVTLSNDSWFAAGGGPRLHLVVSAFRSLETRRAQLRVTNTGISAVIAPTGEILATAGVHERAALTAEVYPESGARTLMLAWGNWFGPGAAAAAFFLLCWSAISGSARRRGRGDGVP